MEPHQVLSVVSSDVDVLAKHGDERPHEEISKGISTVPGRVRNGSLQKTFADPSKCDNQKVGRVSRDNSKARESILKEDLAENVSLSLHNSFCLNRESKMKGLPNQAKRL